MVRSKTLGNISELTLVNPIKPGMIAGQQRSHRTQLIETLRALYSRHARGIPTAPSLLGTIHFARWFIVDAPAPPCGCPPAVPQPGSLVLTTNFDGSLDTYLREFTLRIPEEIDSLWSNCVGYPEDGCRDFDRFYRWIRTYQVETLAFIADDRDTTVGDLRLWRAQNSASTSAAAAHHSN